MKGFILVFIGVWCIIGSYGQDKQQPLIPQRTGPYQNWLSFLTNGFNQPQAPPPRKEPERDLEVPDDFPAYEEPDQRPRVRIDPEAYCRKNSQPNLEAYCASLRDGTYYDPWNPYCGYIECIKNKPHARVCSQGTWMGASRINSPGTKAMCRKAINDVDFKITEKEMCPRKTDILGLCEKSTPFPDFF